MLKKREHTSRRIYEFLFSLAVPIVVGSLITQISGLVDVLTVQRGLSSMLFSDPQGIFQVYPGLSNGLINQGAADVPAYLYGCFRGFATPIYALVPNLTAVIGVGLRSVSHRLLGDGGQGGCKQNSSLGGKTDVGYRFSHRRWNFCAEPSVA